MVTLYQVGGHEFKKCSKPQVSGVAPVDLENSKTVCENMKLDFNPSQYSELLAGIVLVGKSQNSAIITFYSKIMNPSANLAGYLHVDIKNKVAEYHDLRYLNGQDITIINSTYYILHRGPILTLHHITSDLLYLRAP
jgi:hypothetical protein